MPACTYNGPETVSGHGPQLPKTQSNPRLVIFATESECRSPRKGCPAPPRRLLPHPSHSSAPFCSAHSVAVTGDPSSALQGPPQLWLLFQCYRERVTFPAPLEPTGTFSLPALTDPFSGFRLYFLPKPLPQPNIPGSQLRYSAIVCCVHVRREAACGQTWSHLRPPGPYSRAGPGEQ